MIKNKLSGIAGTGANAICDMIIGILPWELLTDADRQ
jgi:hypothetical protein